VIRVTSILAVVLGLCLAGIGEAAITIRRHAAYDSFFFHGNYSAAPFVPSTGFGLEVWNCADGTLPTFIADREPLVVCGFDAQSGFVLAHRVFAVTLAGGACVDHGRSCYYRDASVPSARLGIRFLRIQYARRGHGNRVWLESFGDLSTATQASMLILITSDGTVPAALGETFTPLPNGGWFSPF
jgi:hypothetical protein